MKYEKDNEGLSALSPILPIENFLIFDLCLEDTPRSLIEIKSTSLYFDLQVV